MKAILNQRTLLGLIGVLQPLSPLELAYYLKEASDDNVNVLDEDIIRNFCMKQEKLKRLIRVRRNPDLFSLTSTGNDFLPQKHRFARDKARIYLLKESRKGRIVLSREGLATGSGGAAPSTDERPNVKGPEANKIAPSVPRGQSCWPRFSKQLVDQTGHLQPSRDTLDAPLPFISFDTDRQLCIAAGMKADEADKLKLDFTTIGLMLGISPRLIVQIIRKPERHYREFKLKKKGGGERLIESPRNFLKLIQHFLNDYYLSGLQVHHCVHSYRVGHSILSNASPHSGKQFVGNFDIQNFFGSVTVEQVIRHLMDMKFDKESAVMISQLCCKNDVLPQGAPTSPAISNSILIGFDKTMNDQCNMLNLTYSRYADDITISGDDRKSIEAFIVVAGNLLQEKYALSLNKKKTRIASQGGQQRVTGIVVNDGARPPRKFRRHVRAAFHNASQKQTVDGEVAARLRGYVSYLMAFPDIQNSSELEQYRQVLGNLRVDEAGKP